MKNIIVLVFSFALLSADIKPTPNEKAEHAIGANFDGIVYRQYSKDGYTEYFGSFALRGSNSSYRILAGVNIGKYFYTSYNEQMDFGIKYFYGLSHHQRGNNSDAEPVNLESVNGSYYPRYNGETITKATFGLGAELISPLEKGFLLELRMGQNISYNYENGSIESDGNILLSIMMNY